MHRQHSTMTVQWRRPKHREYDTFDLFDIFKHWNTFSLKRNLLLLKSVIRTCNVEGITLYFTRVEVIFIDLANLIKEMIFFQ